MDIDKALENTIGRKWGRYQSITFPLISVPYIFQALFYLSYVFTTMQSDHRQERTKVCISCNGGENGAKDSHKVNAKFLIKKKNYNKIWFYL